MTDCMTNSNYKVSESAAFSISAILHLLVGKSIKPNLIQPSFVFAVFIYRYNKATGIYVLDGVLTHRRQSLEQVQLQILLADTIVMKGPN